MGWGDDLLQFAGKLGLGVGAGILEVPKLPHSYAGAPGRKHPNESVVADGPANYNDQARPVYLASRIVGGGFLGGTFGLVAQLATHPTSGIPDPTHHWCITVGDYLHQLQATSLNGGWNYYTNEQIQRYTGGWSFFLVGATTLNDVAIRDVSTNVMNEMPEIYNAFNNNCQTFSLRLVDRILTMARKQKFLMANFTVGIQKTPKMDIKVIHRPEGAQIDTGEEVDPTELNNSGNTEEPASEVEPGATDSALVPGELIGIEHDKEDAESSMTRADLLESVAKIMVFNTPTLTEDDVEVAQETPIALAS